MKIGVVVISYNNERHIHDAIQSLKEQTFRDWTCVLVDNGSTDQTFALMAALAKNDDRFTAYRKENEGPGPGRNFGFERLPEDIDYIHFLDGDDMLYPGFLEQMGHYLDENPRVGLVACQFDEIDNDGNFIKPGYRTRYAPSKWGIPRDIPPHEPLTPFVSFFSSTAVGPYGMYRRSVFVQTEGYTLKSQEDTDMFCQMSLLSEVHYIPERLYLKRITSNNLAFAEHYVATHIYFRRKWNNYYSEDPKINTKIERALKYYYTLHSPLRDFKVGMKAVRNFIRYHRLHSLKWAGRCFKNGVIDLLFRRSYRKALSIRKQHVKTASANAKKTEVKTRNIRVVGNE